uniref:Uncharacterized protein n=1 Tax=Physcomitrium patens TaxID=3218 RepID=A0A7I3ZSB4_PHYPA
MQAGHRSRSTRSSSSTFTRAHISTTTTPTVEVVLVHSPSILRRHCTGHSRFKTRTKVLPASLRSLSRSLPSCSGSCM